MGSKRIGRRGPTPHAKTAARSTAPVDRRTFLAGLGGAGALLAARPWLEAIGYAQTRGPARAFVRPRPGRTAFDRRVLGSFLEHLGRAVYTGVYQPGSPLADAKGFRTDVAREIKELAVPIVRYPGGNFVSGYNWLDGVGPKAQRPTVLDRAWNTLESNQFGTNEFIEWCGVVGTEPLLGMNFGTGSVESALAYVEYCNLARGTRWSDLRRSHGYEQPHGVKYWCLGNEMDGPWQIGQLQAREYGRKARDAAKQMRVVDPKLQLIACGSSGTFMPTYLVWDREVLEECYDQVDGLSLHAYYGNTKELSGNSAARYLAMNLDMDRHIHEVAAVCDYVQGLQRSSKRLWLSFDEWNVWYRARDGNAVDGRGAAAPKLLEEVYNLEDALLVGGFVNTLLRNADRVRVACLAQLVNVIAPLVTNDQGVLRQSTYYPYAWALRYAKGRVLDLRVEAETYAITPAGLQPDFARAGDVPVVDVVATHDEPARQAAVLVLNRDLTSERELTVDWEGVTPARVLAAETLTGADLKAFNTFEAPRRVAPQPLPAPTAGSRMTLKLPPRSYTVVHLGL
jgi:alpha-N-arabinofuranosidase